MRLNRWVWAGIVLSMVWAIGAALYTYNSDVEHATNYADFARKVCTDNNQIANGHRYEDCNVKWQADFKLMMPGVGNAAFVALAPLPVFWLAGFCLLYIARAQVAGFRAVIPWPALSRWRRVFVVFCILMTAASLIFGLMIIMNQYTDAEVPVIPEMKTFNKMPSGDVEVIGTWTRPDLGDDDTILDPLQTSRILCIKAENRCTEAKASVSGQSLRVEQFDYTVQSWTDSAIVLENDWPCSVEIFTIDLNTEAVTGAGHKTNQSDRICQTSFNREGSDHWSYALEDGFKVYWAMRMKARPFALRVMQTLLGN